MATQRFYDGQPGPDIRRELNNFEAILDGTVASAQDASTAATSASAKAQQWADAAPGVEVETGKYSAKHWADRAQTTVTGGLIYRGSHSAASGAYPATPSLGDYYKISAAGTLGGVGYSVGDSIIYNGTGWDKIDSTDAVTSVAGRAGAVVLTKGDVGLGNVDNTSDANKPISAATQTALNAKVDKVAGKGLSTEDYTTAEKSKLAGVAAGAQVNTVTSVAGKTGAVTLVKGDVGLGNVDNTSDANKPVSTATQTALNAKEGTVAVGTAAQFWRGDKTWTDFATTVRASILTGLSTATNAVVAATDTVLAAIGKLQKQVSDNLATLTSHTGNTSNPHGVTKVQVGLGNVDNTSDANKPVSTAQAAAIAARYGKDNVLGTVSQSAGVPTGAVIERGSNANGEYVRFADGTQICTRFIPIGGTPPITLAYGALFQSNVDIAWDYPAAFIAQPVIGGAVTGGLAFTWLGLGSAGSSQTGANFVAFSPVSSGAVTMTTLSAVGRWF
jgi:hypothetical protein